MNTQPFRSEPLHHRRSPPPFTTAHRHRQIPFISQAFIYLHLHQPLLAFVTTIIAPPVSASNSSVAAVSHVLTLHDPYVRRLRSTSVATFSITVADVHTPNIRLGVHPLVQTINFIFLLSGLISLHVQTVSFILLISLWNKFSAMDTISRALYLLYRLIN
ncbi:uncharacterized protein DS421_7g221340 [Arachis hypogaea]|nr:uncharacterized protein DS421_7g221340 [Arachis hypogaea]